jgi:hypothetical protein
MEEIKRHTARCNAQLTHTFQPSLVPRERRHRRDRGAESGAVRIRAGVKLAADLLVPLLVREA